MKPLNRPMFRYGGPIKEGVMNGIKEPRQNYQEAGRVRNFFSNLMKPALNADGTPVTLPNRNFVEDLTFVAGPSKFLKAGGAGLTAIRNMGKYPKFPPGYRSGAGDKFVEPKFLSNEYLKSIIRPYTSGMKETFSGVGGKIKDYGYAGTIGGAGIGYGVKKTKDFFDSLNKNKKIDTTLDNIQNTPFVNTNKNTSDASKKGGGVELSAEERRAKNVERYRDIMDIKGMNKDAAYNSLIAASQAINESGDFKGDIKSGKLINQIIQATSKQFDKPKATKDAIDTLILKGEIEKDIKASDPSNEIVNRLREVQIKKGEKELKGNTTAEIIQARMLKDDMPSGSNLASLISINNPELNVKVLPTKDLGNADPVDYMTKIVATVNADETTPDYPSGVYVLKDKVIQITEEGAVVPVPISALK